jgi:hypothetical protein
MFSQSPKRQLLEAIFTERLRQGTMPMEHKRLLWNEMASVGSASIVGESWKTSEPKSLPDLGRSRKQLGAKNYKEFFSMEN